MTTASLHGPLRVGIGGPVGSGKTALAEALCKSLRDHHDLFVITNDIYTREDQRILTEAGALPAERIEGVETGGCPHTAIPRGCLDKPLRDCGYAATIPIRRTLPDRVGG